MVYQVVSLKYNKNAVFLYPGLLGINGAGKVKTRSNGFCLEINIVHELNILKVGCAFQTSTFKMLTGDLPISQGDAYVCSRSVRRELKKVHEVIGTASLTIRFGSTLI
jgi:hypothetical protein